MPLRAYVVVVAGAVLVQMFWARTVFLFSDDYIFLTQGLHAELTWDYLKEPLFGHFSPVSRLTDLLVAPAIHDRPQIIYLVLVCAAAAVVAATAFLMTGALGRTRLALLGTALVGTSLTIVPLTNWYTAGVNILPALTGAFLCFGASVRLLRSPRWWWTVLAVLGYLLAVLSWELAAIIPLYVVVWAVLFRSRIGNPSYGAMLRRGAVAWAALVLIAVAVAVNYLGGYYAAQPSGSVWEIGAAVAVSFVQTLVPLAMGVYPASWGVLGIVVPVLTAVLLAILVRASLRRDRQAWRGWTFAVVGWLVPAVALVLSRVGIFGVSVAQQPMYFLLPVTLATLGALLAWSSPQPAQPTQTRLPLRRRWVAVVSVALLGVGYVLSGPAVVNTLFTYALGKYGTPHPDYVDHLLASVDRLRPGPAFSVLDGDVPGGLVPPTFSPYNRVSTVLDLYAPDVALDSPSPPWYVPDSTGEAEAGDGRLDRHRGLRQRGPHQRVLVRRPGPDHRPSPRAVLRGGDEHRCGGRPPAVPGLVAGRADPDPGDRRPGHAGAGHLPDPPRVGGGERGPAGLAGRSVHSVGERGRCRQSERRLRLHAARHELLRHDDGVRVGVDTVSVTSATGSSSCSVGSSESSGSSGSAS